nr:MAG TPA: hypothetical protein [Caudoviricetes sp.]
MNQHVIVWLPDPGFIMLISPEGQIKAVCHFL